ncbi:DUF732 domain-containing protein [uncultured Microbacterium sp.]|uniref:DUF732 domain-containing protein n=1 Tax=uncultured Microbacterium sp. TaxID=191216 RepID=UPI0025DB3A33|nr:DUF732 domain-containing protein [uncultured Microbacterium sp.]
MKKIGAVAVALAIAAGLSGCGAIPVGTAPKASPTPTVDARAQQVYEQEVAYVRALRQQLPKSDLSAMQVWVDLGHAVCAAFDDGLTPKQVFDSMQGGGVTQQEASVVVVLSGIHLCPEYAPTP